MSPDVMYWAKELREPTNTDIYWEPEVEETFFIPSRVIVILFNFSRILISHFQVILVEHEERKT